MKQDQLFKETPFGGFRQSDVINYLEQLDQQHRNEREELETRIKEQNAFTETLQKQIESMKNELQIKASLAAEGIQAAQKRDELSEELKKQKQENETLSAENKRLKEQVQTAEETQQKNEAAKQEAEEILSKAQKEAEGIRRQAQADAAAIVSEAETQTEALAQQVSDNAREIISMTVNKTEEILNAAKTKQPQAVRSSIRPVKTVNDGRTVMQNVLKNIEQELKFAKATIAKRLQNSGGSKNEP